jgi:hypothetical protein
MVSEDEEERNTECMGMGGDEMGGEGNDGDERSEAERTRAGDTAHGFTGHGFTAGLFRPPDFPTTDTLFLPYHRPLSNIPDHAIPNHDCISGIPT